MFREIFCHVLPAESGTVWWSFMPNTKCWKDTKALDSKCHTHNEVQKCILEQLALTVYHPSHAVLCVFSAGLTSNGQVWSFLVNRQDFCWHCNPTGGETLLTQWCSITSQGSMGPGCVRNLEMPVKEKHYIHHVTFVIKTRPLRFPIFGPTSD